MDPKNNDELLEEYEEALLRLMMNEYMEQEGNRILKELEEAEARGELPEVPAELDARCRKMITDARENGRRKELFTGIIKTASRVAAILMITIGVLTTLVFSVEAIRIPVVDFLQEQHGKYSTIVVNKDEEPTVNTDPTQETDGRTEEDPVIGLLPGGLVFVYSTGESSDMYSYVYQNETGGVLVFVSRFGSDCAINIDTESAESEKYMTSGREGIFVKEESKLMFFWVGDDNNSVYSVKAINIGQDDFWDIIETLINNMENNK